MLCSFFFFNDTATTEIYTLSLHDALPILARLAGLPRAVIDRAREILAALERDELTRGGRPSVSGTPTDPQRQLGLFQSQPADDRLRERLSAVDVDRMTPIEALALLADLKKEAQG